MCSGELVEKGRGEKERNKDRKGWNGEEGERKETGKKKSLKIKIKTPPPLSLTHK